MHTYRTHTCGALRAADAGQPARLSGWVHAKRDHGGLLFIDLRDHYGITQCVFPAGSPAFAAADAARPESVITVTGQVVHREAGTVNPRLPTGEVELRVSDMAVQSAAEVLPMQVAGDEKFPEDIRLKYRFIDLRREKLHRNIMLRAGVIASIRRRMIEAGFTEFQTPILTADSPEGARAFLVPARLHPGTVLRTAAGAAAVQAVGDGGRVRPLLPDRTLLPRRGLACRPLAGRVLPARFRDELRHAGGRVRDDRTGDRRRVRGIRRRPRRDDALPFRAHPVRRRRCWNTAPTSPTCATRCGSPT